MLTLTALILVALLGGIYFKFRRYINKKKASIKEVRQPYVDYDNVYIGQEEADLYESVRRKKITKSKFTKRFV